MLISFGLFQLCYFSAQAQVYTPQPVSSGSVSESPYSLTGFLTTSKGHGSGAVARHKKIVFSCAHVVSM
jgi:hypothetical protein